MFNALARCGHGFGVCHSINSWIFAIKQKLVSVNDTAARNLLKNGNRVKSAA
jgi:hypothetical protein